MEGNGGEQKEQGRSKVQCSFRRCSATVPLFAGEESARQSGVA